MSPRYNKPPRRLTAKEGVRQGTKKQQKVFFSSYTIMAIVGLILTRLLDKSVIAAKAAER